MLDTIDISKAPPSIVTRPSKPSPLRFQSCVETPVASILKTPSRTPDVSKEETRDAFPVPLKTPLVLVTPLRVKLSLGFVLLIKISL